MNLSEKLENVSIDELDAFEETYFHDYSKRMSKVDALQKIINNAEGDYSKLSDCLAEIAQAQEEQKESLTKKSKK
jgi:hypothetical protein